LGTDKFWQRVSSDPGHIAFTSGDGSSVLDYAIKDWDYANKDAYADVEYTWDADADTELYVYYSYVGDGNYPKTSSDFRNAYDDDFLGVFSMNDDTNTAMIRDFKNDTVHYKSGAGEPAQITAKAGEGQSADGADDNITIGNGASSYAVNDWTVEGWINVPSGADDGTIFYKGDGNRKHTIELSLVSGKLRARSYPPKKQYKADGTTDLRNAGWKHFVGTRSGTSGTYIKVFVDGAEEGSDQSGVDDAT
jgi:hypothetical protein